MKLKNTSIRSFNCDGIWISPGETVTVRDVSNWEYWVNRGKAMAIGVEIKEGYSREQLEELKMDELRKIGDPIGAKDTSKSELIEEIIQKQG